MSAVKIRHGTESVMASRVTNCTLYSKPSRTQINPTAASRKTGAVISSTVRARFTNCFLLNVAKMWTICCVAAS